MKRGAVIAVSAPSGAGKTTIVKQVLASFPEIVFSVSATTRRRRDNEVDGREYFFISEAEFKEKIERGEFVEWEQFYDYYYGTFKSFIEDTINYGRPVLLEVDVKGALALKKIYPDSHLIFIQPPSLDVLIERLENRQTETPEDFKKRIERARMELSLKDEFDYIVVNNDLQTAVAEAKSLVKNILEGAADGNNTH